MNSKVIYPLGIQTFSKVIEGGLVYVDKTATIHELITQGSVYFFSRPRRFGKSLLVSTLASIFDGQKQLFDGLAISSTDYEFIQYPLITMDFSRDVYAHADEFEAYVDSVVTRIAQDNHIELADGAYNRRFEQLVIDLERKFGQKVVVLIDEYDKPILNNLTEPKNLAAIQAVMRAFYSMIKSLDTHLRFVFITGVSKFAQVSVFSGMNSLTDISMNNRLATLCGITETELNQNFATDIASLSEHLALPIAQLKQDIKLWYNGYKFAANGQSVYNPYSLLSLFFNQEFDNYWFYTATPTFLLDLIKQREFTLTDIGQVELDRSAFSSVEPDAIDILVLLVQTGYLTIKTVNGGCYLLDYPNKEVKQSFSSALVSYFSKVNGASATLVNKLANALNNNDLATFFDVMGVFFAKIPFDITLKHEKYYQSIFYAIITLLGYQIAAEIRTNRGRIDCVLTTASHVYIIEFKLNDTCEAALKQIIDKQYAKSFEDSDKTLVLVGVEFDHQTRDIGRFVIS